MRSLTKLIAKQIRILAKLVASLLPLGDPRIARARSMARTILAELARQGFTYERRGRRKSNGCVMVLVVGLLLRLFKPAKPSRQRIQFKDCLLTIDGELWCPIDMASLPWGTTSSELKKPEVLEGIADRCRIERRSVRIDYLPGNELCYVVSIHGSRFPPAFSFNAFQLAPDAPPLALPLGVSGDREHAWVDLVDLIHLLIVGPTGKGKSTFIHTFITTLVDRNKHHDVQLWLADLKKSEFSVYEPLKARKNRPGIVARLEYEEERVVSMLHDAVAEMKRRQTQFQRVDAVDINDYASITNEHLHRIVIIVDEILQIMQSTNKIEGKTTVRQWAEELLILLASQGRGAGIHVVIATQVVSSKVLTTRILANYESVVCFGVKDWRQSQLAIGESAAEGLPRGRIILKHEQTYREFQSCWLDPSNRRLAVSRISNYGPGVGLLNPNETKRFIHEAMLLLRLSHEQLDGLFSIPKMFALEGVRGVIPKSRLEEIAQRLEKEGVLVRGKSKTSARRIAQGYRGKDFLIEYIFSPPPEPQGNTNATSDVAPPSPSTTVRSIEDGETPILSRSPPSEDSSDDQIAKFISDIEKTMGEISNAMNPPTES